MGAKVVTGRSTTQDLAQQHGGVSDVVVKTPFNQVRGHLGKLENALKQEIAKKKEKLGDRKRNLVPCLDNR